MLSRAWKSLTRRPKQHLTEVLGDTEIPTFPGALMELLSQIRDPDNSMAEVADKVSTDPSLVVRVLNTVNSVAFGLSRTVNSIQHAASLMGRGRLESLILTLAVRDALPQQAAEGFDPQKFWMASAQRASVARALASFLHPKTQAEAFTAGLLQDLAIPLLATARPDCYGKVLNQWDSEPEAELDVLEANQLDWSHSSVGAALAKSWGLPIYLVNSVGLHHEKNGAAEQVEPAIKLVSLIRHSEPGEGIARLVDTTHREYGLDTSTVSAAVDEALDQAGQLVHSL